MTTRPRSLIQPRPNLRRVPPLDPFEQAQVEDPPSPVRLAWGRRALLLLLVTVACWVGVWWLT